jgi:phage recombination protein Bet
MSADSLATVATERKPASSSVALDPRVVERGISPAQWRTLCKSLYPGANELSVLMVWDYCLARRLDPLKKPCHIVPIEVKNAQGRYEWRDVVMPGIYEHRTTAQRTGQYLGHSQPAYGDIVTQHGVAAPEWCAMTIYRFSPVANERIEFPVRVFFREVVALKSGGVANARWTRAPIQMLTKCTEAAGLREAFPDEIGGEATFEEMDGQRHVEAAALETVPALAKPDGYDDALRKVLEAAEISFDTFEKAWADTPKAVRDYLTTTEPDRYEALKSQAQAATQEPSE